jgi:hypothetical protein
MKILIVEDEHKTGDYLKQGCVRCHTDVSSMSTYIRVNGTESEHEFRFVCPAQHRDSRDQARDQQQRSDFHTASDL